LTEDALGNITRTTLQNITDFENGINLNNEVCAEKNLKKLGGFVSEIWMMILLNILWHRPENFQFQAI
jgi:hypothetical protein